MASVTVPDSREVPVGPLKSSDAGIIHGKVTKNRRFYKVFRTKVTLMAKKAPKKSAAHPPGRCRVFYDGISIVPCLPA